MARQPYFVNSSEKQMEIFSSFGGGMVTQAHPEKLNDDQSVLVENGDVVAGGVVQARGAYSKTNDPSVTLTGNTQGRWKYENLAGGQDICAVNGKLYTVVSNTYTQLSITNLATFQSSRPIEAVQYRNMMYFATGSGLVQYDGTTASLVQAYAPNGLEAIYIGTNGYAANPDVYLSDTTGAANVILGVTTSSRYGVVNVNITFTAYIQKIAIDTLEYLFEWKSTVAPETAWAPINKSTWQSAKTITCNFGGKGDYMIRVSMRKVSTTVILSQYVIPKYKVSTTPDEKPEPSINFTNMSTCNKLIIHYDRLMMYGDTTNLDHLYISHLNQFNYYPRTNIIKVTDNMRGTLQDVCQYKDFLVCFTNGSIQGITGTSPLDYAKFPIHTTVGTKFPNSIQVMQNYITFVGNDNAIYILKSFNYAASSDKMNVQRIDATIQDSINGLITTSTMILSAMYNNQYCLYVEGSGYKYIYRYYYDMGIWVRDTVPVSMMTMVNINNKLLLAQNTNGRFYELKAGIYRDDVSTTFNLRILSKDYDFNMPHHRKKLKQYQILAKMTSASTISVSLYTDNTLLSTTSLVNDPNQVTDAQKLKVMASGRFRYVKTDLTITVNELIQLIGFGFVFKQNTPK
jgi:hypothetical protein